MFVVTDYDEKEKCSKIDYYKCGSLKQLEFLVEEKDIMYVSHFVSRKTGKKVWNFVKCEMLNNALTEWREKRNG